MNEPGHSTRESGGARHEVASLGACDRVTVTIDRIVVTGLESAERHALVEALKTGIAAMLSAPDSGLSQAVSSRTPLLRLGRVALAPGVSGARSIGRDIAQAIGGHVGGQVAKNAGPTGRGSAR